MLKKKPWGKYKIIIVIVLLAIISLGWHSKQKRGRLNVLLISVDAFRPDHLGCYGYQRDTSCNIDRLSKQGIRFAQAIAAGGWTAESVPSILTGTYSLSHQIRSWRDLRNHSIKTLASQLAVKDYQCVLFSNHGPMKYLDIKDGFQGIYVRKHCEVDDRQLTIEAIDWLKAHKDNSPFFLYIHYHGSHTPYRLSEPYKSMYLYDKFRGEPEFVSVSKLKLGGKKYYGDGVIPYIVAENGITDVNYYISQYDAAIYYVDIQIGRLIDSLKKTGLNKNTLIILTADHGEMLGEHNLYFEHRGGYEENIRVPLIIRFAGLFPKPKVISRQVSLIDIAPTILELVGLDKPSYMQGESLMAFIKPLRIYDVKYVYSFFNEYSTLRTEEWKLICYCDTGELYNLKEDPREHHNLSVERADKFKQLKQELEGFKRRISCSASVKQGSALTEEDKQRLRSLGYAQ